MPAGTSFYNDPPVSPNSALPAARLGTHSAPGRCPRRKSPLLSSQSVCLRRDRHSEREQQRIDDRHSSRIRSTCRKKCKAHEYGIIRLAKKNSSRASAISEGIASNIARGFWEWKKCEEPAACVSRPCLASRDVPVWKRSLSAPRTALHRHESRVSWCKAFFLAYHRGSLGLSGCPSNVPRSCEPEKAGEQIKEKNECTAT